MTDLHLPPDLLRAVQHDLAPVRPLASPGRRLAAMLPLAIALLLLPPMYWGWRSNFAELGGVLSWALSALESVAGLGLLWMGFRNSIPGAHRGSRGIGVAMAMAAALFAAITLLTDLEFPTTELDGVWLRSVFECIRMELPFALPSVLLVSALVARALPDRPALVGAACGFGVGLMTDAGVRLFCWVSEPSHVLASHGTAIALSAVGGALAAIMVERGKRATLRSLQRPRTPGNP